MATQNLTYIIGSVILAFSAANVSIYYLRSQSGFDAIHIYMSILMTTSSLAMLRYLVPKQRFVGARMVSTHAQKLNEVVITNVAMGGTIVFALGAIFFDTVCLVAEIDCLRVFFEDHCHWNSHLTLTIYLPLKVLFIGLQMWFLFSEGYTITKLGHSNTSRYVFIFNATVNFTVIFYTSLHVVTTDMESPTTCTAFLPRVNSSEALMCIAKKTMLFKFRESLGPYLYPFHSEYCILAMTLNLILWKHCLNARKSTERKPVFVGESGRVVRSRGDSRQAERVPDSLSSADSDTECDGTEQETDALVPKREGERQPVEMDSTCTFTGTFRSIQIESRDGHAEADDMDSSLPVANGYGTVENEVDNDDQPIRRGGVVGIFKECERCSGCLNPRPRYIYGPDNGCGLLAFIGFALLIVYTVPTTLLATNGVSRQLFTTLYVLTLILNAVMLVAAILLAIGTSKKLDLGPKFHKTLSVGSIALLSSAFVFFFYDFLFAGAAWSMALNPPNMTEIIHDHKKLKELDAQSLLQQNVMDVITVAADCLQVALQTNIVINNHWMMKRSYFDDVISTSTMMQCTSFLMAANFCKWVAGSIIEIHRPKINLAQTLYYGDENWKTLVYLLYPFVIYYRFHCTMAFGEYMNWRRGLLDAGRATASRAGFVPSVGTLAY